MNTNIKLLRLQAVIDITGLSRSTILALCSQNAFPRKVYITPKTVAWISEEVHQWLEERISRRNEAHPRNMLADRNDVATLEAFLSDDTDSEASNSAAKETTGIDRAVTHANDGRG